MTAVKDETDEADEAENDAAMLASAVDVAWWPFLLLGAGLAGAAGGVALLPHCESTVEWGLIMRSDTEEADDESMLIVLLELVGENCWSCWLSGL